MHAIVVPSPSEGGPASEPQVHEVWVASDRSDPFRAQVLVEDVPVEMELDTGAGVSIISESTLRGILPHAKL